MSFPRVTALVTAACLLAVAGGCLDATTTVDLGADGSGTVTEEVFVTQPMERMLAVMSSLALGMIEGGTNAAPAATGLVNRVKFETRAAGMGQGVRLVTLEKAQRREGAHGVRAVYAFDDIRRLQLPVDPPYPIPDFGASPSGDTARVTFDFEPAPRPVLTAFVPWAEAARRSEAARQTARPSAPISQEDAAMLRHVLDGFRARLVVISPKGVYDTDASFTETSSDLSARKSVVLYDMNFGVMVRDESLLEQAAALGPARDMNDALGRYAGLAGFKVESKSKVTIRF